MGGGKINLDLELERLDKEFSFDDTLTPLKGIKQIIGQDGPLALMLEYMAGGKNIFIQNTLDVDSIRMVKIVLQEINAYAQLSKEELLENKKIMQRENAFTPSLEDRLIDVALQQQKVILQDQVAFHVDERYKVVRLPAGYGRELHKDLAELIDEIKQDHVSNANEDNHLLALQEKLLRKYSTIVKNELDFDRFKYHIHAMKLGTKGFSPKKHIKIRRDEETLSEEESIRRNKDFDLIISVLHSKLEKIENCDDSIPLDEERKDLIQKRFPRRSQQGDAEIIKIHQELLSWERKKELIGTAAEEARKLDSQGHEYVIRPVKKTQEGYIAEILEPKPREEIKSLLRKRQYQAGKIREAMDREYRDLKAQTAFTRTTRYLSRLQMIIDKWKEKPEFKDKEEMLGIFHSMYKRLEHEGIVLDEKNHPNTRSYEAVLLDDKAGSDFPIVFSSRGDIEDILGNVNDFDEVDANKSRWGKAIAADGGWLVIKSGEELFEIIERANALRDVIDKREIQFHPSMEAVDANFSTIIIGGKKARKIVENSNNGVGFKTVYLNQHMENNHHNRTKVARYAKSLLDERDVEIEKNALVSLVQFTALNGLSGEYYKEGFLHAGMVKLYTLIDGVTNNAYSLGIDKITREMIGSYLMQERENESIHGRIVQGYLINDRIVHLHGEAVGRINTLYTEKSNNKKQSYGGISEVVSTQSNDTEEMRLLEADTEYADDDIKKSWELVVEFFRRKFGTQKFPIRHSFPYEYEKASGNSSSAGSLAASISALSKIPCSLGKMVTGALYSTDGVIGGVDYIYPKIKGGLDFAKAYGINGEQAGIIPTANLKQLVLSAQFDQELTRASRDGIFHLYHVNHIDDLLDFLGEKGAEEHYKEIERKIKSRSYFYH